jgi:protein-tyrosine phosphatase
MKLITIDSNGYNKSLLIPAAESLKSGGLVIFPTETVYGIAVNADSSESVEKLIKIKKSPKNRPFTYHIADPDDICNYVKNIPLLVRRLINRFWPGPLTIVLEDETKKWIGFRCPDDLVARDLIRMAGVPIVAPSANFAEKEPPREVNEISNEVKEAMDFVIDTGKTKYGEASTVVRVFMDNKLEIIREGAIKKDDIKKEVVKTIIFVCTGNTCRSPMAEGLCRKIIADKLGIKKYLLEENGYKIISAGTAAIYNSPASSHAIEVIKELGVDIANHRSQPVTLSMLDKSDQVYCMTKEHLNTLKEWMPLQASRIFLLDPEGENIIDPIGGSADLYRQVAFKIKKSLESIINKIISYP